MERDLIKDVCNQRLASQLIWEPLDPDEALPGVFRKLQRAATSAGGSDKVKARIGLQLSVASREKTACAIPPKKLHRPKNCKTSSIEQELAPWQGGVTHKTTRPPELLGCNRCHPQAAASKASGQACVPASLWGFVLTFSKTTTSGGEKTHAWQDPSL